MTRGDAPLDRDVAARLGRETVQFLRERGYNAPSGHRVDLAPAAEYPLDAGPQAGDRRARGATRITVENATVLDVGRRMAEQGPVAALNFASATEPGGGFLRGARAQENAANRQFW